jgi:hypothetical protein
MQQDIITSKPSGTVQQVNTPVAVAAPSDGTPSLSQVQDVAPAPQTKQAQQLANAKSPLAPQPQTASSQNTTDQKPEKKDTPKAPPQKANKAGKPIGAIIFAIVVAGTLAGLAVYAQLQAAQ